MAKFTFADRYAEAGLQPSAQVITSRQEPAKRIIDDITDAHILDLAAVYYYGTSGLDLSWLRNEFIQADDNFSLVNNERETRVLAALMLGELVANERSVAILAVIVGGVMGHHSPSQSGWLLSDAREALGRLSVAERRPKEVHAKVVATSIPKLSEEIAALTQNDWATLLAMLGKIRAEAQASAKTTAAQSTKALTALNEQVKLMREESQMLWWLFGGHSRSLERSFDNFSPQQAALVGAVDLGALTTESLLGPVAAPAMLERVIALAKRPKGTQPRDLGTVVDSFTPEDIERLEVFLNKLPPRLAPVTTAIDLARTMGIGAWHAQFKTRTGLDASVSFEPLSLAEQLYREHLLGQLL